MGRDVSDFFEDGGTPEKFEKNVEEYSAEYEGSPDFNLSDAGNAEFLAANYKNIIRYNHTEHCWLIWNGQYWKKDFKNVIHQFAIKSAKKRQRDASNIVDHDKKNIAFKFGVKSEDHNKIQSCLSITKSIEGIATLSSDWDKDQGLLQFNNGTLDLRTKLFRDGKPEDMISYCTGYDYAPNANCELWRKSLNDIMDNKNEMISFLRRAIGYSLAGETSEQCFFMMYGTGANGKSVVLEVIRRILGDYSKDSPFTAFERRFAGNAQSNDLARLHSIRLVTSSESGFSKRLDEERLKAITGGDPITARFLHKEFFTYNPHFKLWLAVNSLPKTEDFSDGFWRRVRVIPFEVQFKGDGEDKDLTSKLMNELPGIMNWAIAGYKEWQKIGLSPPDKVIQATHDYQVESDIVAEFVENFVVEDKESHIMAGELYKEFEDWHEKECPGKPMSQTSFGRRVSMVINQKSDKIRGRKVYVGWKLVKMDENNGQFEDSYDLD